MILLLLGCGGAPEPPTVYELPTPVVLPTPPEESTRRGDVGDLFVLQRGPTREQPVQLGFYALFAEELAGSVYPSACRWAGLLCAPPGAIPGEPVEPVDVTVTRSAWLGDSLTVGGYELGFSVDPDGPVGGYDAVGLLEGSLPTRVDLIVERGEWGTFESVSAVPRPDAWSDLEPDPLEPIVLGGRRFVELSWNPTGGRIWVTAEGNGLQLLRPVPDLGYALVDLEGVRFREPVDVTLWRVHSSEREVEGNTLRVHSAAAQSWCVVDTCDEPTVPGWPAHLPFSYCWSPDSCASSQWILHRDGTWDAEGSLGGTWSWDCCTGELVLTFVSGTVYRGPLVDGCVDGEMVSWSGARGTWSGCF